MKIKIKISPSENSKSVTVSLNDLWYSKEQWESLSEEDQLMEIDNYVSGFDQPYWSVDSFDSIEER